MRRHRIAVAGIVLLLMQPFAAHAQSFEELMFAIMTRRSEMLAEIDLYLKRTILSGITRMALPDGDVGPCIGMNCQAMTVDPVVFPDGEVRYIERPLSPLELGVLTGRTDSVFMEAIGNGFIDAQIAVNQGIGAGPQDRSFFENMFDSDEDGEEESGPPMQSYGVMMALTNPTMVFGVGGAMILDAAPAAEQAEQDVANSAQISQAEAGQVANVARQIEFVRNDYIGNTPVAVYGAPNVDLPPQNTGDGQSFAPGGIEVSVDVENQRIVATRMEGVATADGESRDFYIETEFSDFRNPPGCGTLVEPFRQVMRMGGLLNDEQMAEMEEVREQIAEFEQQLATMPPEQRAMMEEMMGPQMEMMRGLGSGGAIEYIQETEDILCNPDLASLFAIEGAPSTVGAVLPQLDEADLVRQIQEYLVILGYEPGNIDGVLDDLTIVAISQYQAEQGLPVTGEPSVELANMLAEAIGL